MTALTPLSSWLLLVTLIVLVTVFVVVLCNPYMGDLPHDDLDSSRRHADARSALRAAGQANGTVRAVPSPSHPRPVRCVRDGSNAWPASSRAASPSMSHPHPGRLDVALPHTPLQVASPSGPYDWQTET